MFFDPACIPCIIEQAYKAAVYFSEGDKALELKIVKEVCEEVKVVNENYTAPQFSIKMQSIIERNLGRTNPFEKQKKANIAKAKKILPLISEYFEKSTDKLEAVVRIAIAGNIIDIGANPDFDIVAEIETLGNNNVELTELPRFRNAAKSAKLILYIADNYEEALFDKFLLTSLAHCRVVFAVRSYPILNDITLEDAEELGINKICEVIESGSKIAGNDLSVCNEKFIEIFNEADMVIAKGQGNYETLLNVNREIYFMFKVKCKGIADRSGLSVGKGALLHKPKFKENNNEKI
jgi:uncharacterized protein with ATP-grasp and redox domains